jgi:urease accessory protein
MILGQLMRRRRVALSVAIAAALAGTPAWSHHFMDNALPGTFAEGLLSGLGHPLIGLDHAAFIVATGFFLARVKGGLWGVATLIAGSLVGAAAHLNGVDIAGGEIGVALSVMAVGILLMLSRWRIEPAWLGAGLALAGALHGHAYAEAIFGAEATPLGAYLIGFSCTQVGVAAAAFYAHRRLLAARRSWANPVGSVLGAAAGAVGAVFLALNVAG